MALLPSIADILDRILQPVDAAQLSFVDTTCLVCHEQAVCPVKFCCTCRYVFCRDCAISTLAQSDRCPTCQTTLLAPMAAFSAIFALSAWASARSQRFKEIWNPEAPLDVSVRMLVVIIVLQAVTLFQVLLAYYYETVQVWPLYAILIIAGTMSYEFALVAAWDDLHPPRGAFADLWLRAILALLQAARIPLSFVPIGALMLELVVARFASVLNGTTVEDCWMDQPVARFGGPFTSIYGSVAMLLCVLFLYGSVILLHPAISSTALIARREPGSRLMRREHFEEQTEGD